MSLNLKTSKIFEESESNIPPLGNHILPHLQKSTIYLNLIDDAPSLDVTPWMLPAPTACFDLKPNLKKINPEMYKQFCLQLTFRYPLLETFSWMVLKQRQESLQWLSPPNIPRNLDLLPSGQQFHIYCRITSLSLIHI